MTLGTRAGFALLATTLIGCAGNEPFPELFAISPNQAYSNQDVRVTLMGAGLIPSFRIDPSTDQRVAVMDGFSGRIGKEPNWAPLTLFGWMGPEQISATLGREDAEELVRSPPICPCDVEITDPRGRTATLTDAFTELGMDTIAPTISVESPVAGEDDYCPGANIHAHFIVSDTAPGYLTSVRWDFFGSTPDRDQGGFCPFEPGSSLVDCSFDVTIDDGFAPGNRVYIFVRALDNAGQMARVECPVVLKDQPAIKEVTPNVGSTTGGTDVIIVGAGTKFAHDSRAYFDGKLLSPDGGRISDDGTMISGYTPPHPAGNVTVSVISRLGKSVKTKAFTYLGATSGTGP